MANKALAKQLRKHNTRKKIQNKQTHLSMKADFELLPTNFDELEESEYLRYAYQEIQEENNYGTFTTY